MLAELLLTLFIGLKLTNNIDWSWFWVLSPLWIGVILSVLIGILRALTDDEEQKQEENTLWFDKNK